MHTGYSYNEANRMEHKSDDTFPFSGVKKLQILFLLAVNDFNTWGVFVGSSKEFTL
jgi:hypothetical protein